MKLSGLEVIVFDLDDTLTSEQVYAKSGFQAVCRFIQGHGVSQDDFFSKMWKLFCSGTRGTLFNDVLAEAGIDPAPELVQKLVEVYRTHTPVIALYPDAAGTLDFFHGKKRLGLISDGYEETQTRKLEALDIRRYFDCIVLTDILGRQFWKPHPAGFEKVMETLGVPGNCCVYIGDNPHKDFATPRSLGWKTVRIQREEGLYSDIEPADEAGAADLTLAELSPLLEIIQ